jgi:hypothetical protein
VTRPDPCPILCPTDYAAPVRGWRVNNVRFNLGEMMYLVRNVFQAKPGQSKTLSEIFKKAAAPLKATGLAQSVRVLTDASAGFWTVVVESEVEDLNAYMDMTKIASKHPELGEAMKGYADLTTGGHREIYRIE